MANIENLRSHGWYVTSESLNKIFENESVIDNRILTRRALDIDIRDFGAPVITSEINKPTFGPVVLQIVKIRNISAPKSKQNSQTAPRMLKIILTDGHTNCQGIETNHLSFLNLEKTIPGTKLLIDKAPVLSGCILLTSENCKYLGGNVNALVEKWELSKLLPNHIRITEDGPPAWVNFGKRIMSNSNNQNFKSLENKNKENTKENIEFQVQRQDAIAEAAQGAVKKVFGGGTKPVQTANEPTYHPPARQPRAKPHKHKEKNDTEKIEKASQKVSLFDYLEDKLSLDHTKNNPTSSKMHVDYLPKSKHDVNIHEKLNKYKNIPHFEKPKLLIESRFQNDKPPRFQKQQSSDVESPRSKLNTDVFVDKLSTEINNISLYNSKYENDKLKLRNSQYKNHQWKIGDRCLAKYWEDDKFYNAIITGITNRTFMVEFTDYGNFEEVLHCDCIPVVDEKAQRNYKEKYNDNQIIAGHLEFRRAKGRSIVKFPPKSSERNNNS